MISHAINLKDRQFDRLFVLQQEGNKNGNAMWRVRCTCGVEKTVSGTGLRNGSIKSCGCLRAERARAKPCLQLLGRKFGRLEVKKKLGNSGGGVEWLCKCDCGNECKVIGSNLTHGAQSCGCYALEMRRQSRGCTPQSYMFRSYQYSAAKRGLEWTLENDEFFSMTQQNCHYCGGVPRRSGARERAALREFCYNGLDRKNNFVGYTTDNVVPCCKICNWAKGKLSYDDFIAYLERVRTFRSRIACA